MKKIELLAPAGNMECLRAAVMAGCDAVYLGGTLFGARAFAGNFTDEELKEAVNYCHLYDVKVYVTCNILIYEHEVEHFINYIRFLHQISVDAIIIQDLGMLDLVHQKFPNLELDFVEDCSECHGKGGIGEETCSTCHGSGTVTSEQHTILGSFLSKTTCPDCHGTGHTYKKKCTSCNGKGKVRKNRTITVKIPLIFRVLCK